jgi:hypothetical protein
MVFFFCGAEDLQKIIIFWWHWDSNSGLWLGRQALYDLRPALFRIIFLVGLGFELRAFAVAKQAFYCLGCASVSFALVILEMGSCELFAWAGPELLFPRSQPPK